MFQLLYSVPFLNMFYHDFLILLQLLQLLFFSFLYAILLVYVLLLYSYLVISVYILLSSTYYLYWYMFCYCILIILFLVYILLLDSFGIRFVISTPMTDLPILSQHAFSSSSCSLLTPFWPSSQSLSPVISLPSLPLFRFFLCSCSSFSSSLMLWFDY